MTPETGYERMPRNSVDAERDGWVKLSETCENEGKWAGFRWVDAKDDAVVLMYDVNGYVSGIQSLVRKTLSYCCCCLFKQHYKVIIIKIIDYCVLDTA